MSEGHILLCPLYRNVLGAHFINIGIFVGHILLCVHYIRMFEGNNLLCVRYIGMFDGCILLCPLYSNV
jgi:hypothetical protein